MNRTHSLLLTLCVSSTLAITGCHDDERHGPHASHAHPQDTPTRPVGETVVPNKTEIQAKVAGTPSDTAKPAPAGEPAGAAPSKTNETNKVTGSPNNTAQPDPQTENTRAVPSEKAPVGGKDATP